MLLNAFRFNCTLLLTGLNEEDKIISKGIWEMYFIDHGMKDVIVYVSSYILPEVYQSFSSLNVNYKVTHIITLLL